MIAVMAQHHLEFATALTVGAAGGIFLLALILGVWKYRQMATSPEHLAHPYVDIAHRAALMYSFATLLVAVFVEALAQGVPVYLEALKEPETRSATALRASLRLAC